MTKELKLNLGCNVKKLAGFLNVDIRQSVEPDLVEDAFTLESIKNNSVSLIYFCHGIEHANYSQARKALKRYYDILKDDGELRLAVPDMQAAMEIYLYHNRDLKLIRSMLSGSQIENRAEFDIHYSHWDWQTLTEELKNAGFNRFERFDPRLLPPHDFCDDYSSAVLPFRHLWNPDRTLSDAKMTSLNIRAWKK